MLDNEDGLFAHERPGCSSGLTGPNPLAEGEGIVSAGDPCPRETSALPTEYACPQCGATKTREILLDGGPHRARLVCDACGRWIKFLPAEWTLERAQAFRLEFGKYRGLTIGEVARRAAGHHYLRWMAETLEGGPARAAELVLAATVKPGYTSTIRRRRPG